MLCVAPVGPSCLVCMFADKSANVGMVKANLLAIAQQLETPIAKINVVQT